MTTGDYFAMFDAAAAAGRRDAIDVIRPAAAAGRVLTFAAADGPAAAITISQDSA